MKVLVYSCRKDERIFLTAAFEQQNHSLQFEEGHLNPLTARLAEDFDAVAVFVNDQVNAEVLATLAELKVKAVALRCAGYNNVDLAAAKSKNIAVVRVPAYSPYAVAEHSLAMLLALNRHIHKAYNRVRDGNFSLDGLMGQDIHGKTFGVIGTGTIGEAFCRVMTGFGCQIIASDPYPSDSVKALGVEYVDLQTLYAQSDFISLHCPLTPETHHLIDEASLGLMKQGVVLINTSRGGLVDTGAVIQALKSEKLGGLALDVYEEEGDLFFQDLSNSVIADDELMRLTTFPNVIITGHQAFLTKEAVSNIASTTAQNLTELSDLGRCVNQL